MKTVTVRGVGIVSPLGIGVDSFWSQLLAGKCAIRESPRSTRDIPVPAWSATLKELESEIDESVDARALRRVSNLSRYAVAAAQLAIPRGKEDVAPASDAALPSADDTAVILGTSFGSACYHFDYYERLFRGGIREASPLLFSESVMNAASGHVSLYLQLRGASLALVGGEEVGLTAIADGAERVAIGDALAAFAGGADEYCDFVHAGLASREFVSGEPAEPYGGGESRAFFGEGSALLLLEAPDAADPQRGPPLAVVAGWGVASGAEGVEDAVRQSLRQAGVDRGDVDLLVTSASGGAEDAAEVAGLNRILGKIRGKDLFVAAPKAALGEGFAFTSAAQAVVAVNALVTQTVPPTPGHASPTRLPARWSLPREAVSTRLRNALAISVNRRGTCAAVVFSSVR